MKYKRRKYFNNYLILFIFIFPVVIFFSNSHYSQDGSVGYGTSYNQFTIDVLPFGIGIIFLSNEVIHKGIKDYVKQLKKYDELKLELISNLIPIVMAFFISLYYKKLNEDYESKKIKKGHSI